MSKSFESAQSATLRTLSNTEIDTVAGGLMIPDITGMPDRRTGGCGTMWLLDRFIDIFRRHR